MAAEVKLPRLGQGMESGTIVRWLKSEGEEVKKGEPLYELDTDKVTQEVEADADGVLLKIAVREGEVPVGQTIAFVGAEGEPVPEEPPPGSAESGIGVEAPSMAPAREPERERGIDLASLMGTGPEGRIVAEDVERAAATPAHATVGAAPLEAEVVPLTSLRKTIARRLTEAWQAPAFQISMSADMTRAQELHARLRDQGVSVTDILTKLAAIALLRHREVNAQFADDELRIFPNAHIGLAVATERGLIVPVQREVERKSLVQIAAERKEIVQRTREGKLAQEDLEGGTFTISNLGMYGIRRFVAVINPPQAAILAVGELSPKPVVRDGNVVVGNTMELTLACDHRILYGAEAAEFLAKIREYLETPLRLAL